MERLQHLQRDQAAHQRATALARPSSAQVGRRPGSGRGGRKTRGKRTRTERIYSKSAHKPAAPRSVTLARRPKSARPAGQGQGALLLSPPRRMTTRKRGRQEAEAAAAEAQAAAEVIAGLTQGKRSRIDEEGQRGAGGGSPEARLGLDRQVGQHTACPSHVCRGWPQHAGCVHDVLVLRPCRSGVHGALPRHASEPGLSAYRLRRLPGAGLAPAVRPPAGQTVQPCNPPQEPPSPPQRCRRQQRLLLRLLMLGLHACMCTGLPPCRAPLLLLLSLPPLHQPLCSSSSQEHCRGYPLPLAEQAGPLAGLLAPQSGSQAPPATRQAAHARLLGLPDPVRRTLHFQWWLSGRPGSSSSSSSTRPEAPPGCSSMDMAATWLRLAPAMVRSCGPRFTSVLKSYKCRPGCAGLLDGAQSRANYTRPCLLSDLLYSLGFCTGSCLTRTGAVCSLLLKS